MALTNVNNWITDHFHMLSFAHVSSLREAVKADIKESRPTVRANRPVQQAKAKIKPSCNRQCYFMSGGFCHKSKPCGDQMAA